MYIWLGCNTDGGNGRVAVADPGGGGGGGGGHRGHVPPPPPPPFGQPIGQDLASPRMYAYGSHAKTGAGSYIRVRVYYCEPSYI